MPEPKPAYNTVSTVVRVLEGKGFIGHKAYGNSHVYFPLEKDLSIEELEELSQLAQKLKNKKRETYYQANRAFLLLICPLSFLIPLVQLDFLKRPVPISALELTGRETVVNVWVWSDYLLAVYVLIALGMVLNLAIKIFKLIRLSANNNKTITSDYKLIETPEEKNAFSFFGYLFINPNLALKETVIHHELIHIRQKHSWDIIYLELMKAISWFNPVIYLLQGSIREIHEFIADRETAGIEGDTDVYTDFLLSNAYGIPNDNLTNQVNQQG
eukprot:gene8366-8453_t